jgi:hypothetical protein
MAVNEYLLEPSAAPLTALLSMLGSLPAKNPKIEWQENEAMPRLTTLSASAASNATAFGVAADIFRVGDVIRFPGQGFGGLVTATAAGAITATKIGSTAQASAASAQEVYLVSNANAEGATLREIKYPQLVTASNYCQIIRTPVGLTETEQATDHYLGNERARLQKEAGIEHARAQEQTFFFGPRDLQSTNQRTCGGLKEFISTNVTADTGGLTESDWQSFLKSGFRYGSDRKVAFCSPTAISVIEGYVRSTSTGLITQSPATNATYGIQMKTYVSGQGTVDLVLHRDWNDSTNYGGFVFLVDMDAVKMRPLRSTRLKTNVQAPDYDGFKDEYITEVGLQVLHERRHALLTGVA